MTSPEGLDLDAVGPWLAARGVVEPGPLDAIRLAGGLSNVTYLVTQGDRSLVIRRPPLGHVMPTAHDMGREFTVLSGVTRGGFPAPQPLACIVLRHDAKTDHLRAVGTLGGEMFKAFFEKYEFKLSIDNGPKSKQLCTSTTVCKELKRYSRQLQGCPA